MVAAERRAGRYRRRRDQTTEPNALTPQIHNRMPLMLAPEDFVRWLGTSADRAALSRPFPDRRAQCA
jgi:putative SOS response-associated peptidase YedK